MDLQSESTISLKYLKEAKAQDMTQESTKEGVKSSVGHRISIERV